MIVHVITRKGFGYDPAERNEADQFHQIGAFDVETGEARPAGRIWTDFFSEEMVALGDERQDIVGITAAMLYPVGLDRFAAAYPERIFDVGIAEQHAVTSAAGLAMGGMHPVVAIYATFLNRAFDQVLMDVALHRCGVTFVLDRAGVTGTDGASHNGMWDLSILQVVPGLRIAAPRDGARVRELLREAVAVGDAPTVVRLPKGAPPADLEAVDRAGGCDVLSAAAPRTCSSSAVGSMASVGVEVGERLAAQGIGVTVVDPRWVKPVDPALVDLARDHRLVVSIEDNGARRRRRLGAPAAAHGRGRDHPVLAARHPAGVPPARRAAGDPRPDRAQRPDHRARHRRAPRGRGPGASDRSPSGPRATERSTCGTEADGPAWPAQCDDPPRRRNRLGRASATRW